MPSFAIHPRRRGLQIQTAGTERQKPHTSESENPQHLRRHPLPLNPPQDPGVGWAVLPALAAAPRPSPSPAHLEPKSFHLSPTATTASPPPPPPTNPDRSSPPSPSLRRMLIHCHSFIQVGPSGYSESILTTLWEKVEKVWCLLLNEVSDETDPKNNVVVVGNPVLRIALIASCLHLKSDHLESFHLDAGNISVIDFPDGPNGG